MKELKTLAGEMKSSLLEIDNRLVHFIATSDGFVAFDYPIFANEITCAFCKNTAFFLYSMNKTQTAWMCANVCEGSRLPKQGETGNHPLKQFRELLWPLFCEINGIGDRYHDVTFEKVKQSQGKINFMINFCEKPEGFIIMQGEPGTGKTYASMGICELFTRKSMSCVFITQQQLYEMWVEKRPMTQFMHCEVLVVDDFGIGDIDPKFLTYFLNMINTRMQWNGRGTVISTNLKNDDLTNYCGHALADRLNTGQKFLFEEQSRRKPIL